MRPRYTIEDLGDSLRRGYNPATKVLILTYLASFVVGLIASWTGTLDLSGLLRFQSESWRVRPWTLVTYPLVAPFDPINLLFSGIWLWFVGGSLERGWGTRVYTWFFFIISAITAMSLTAGLWLTQSLTGQIGQIDLIGMWMPLAALTVAWATLNPNLELLFMFLIPLRAKYLAYIDVALVFLSYGMGNPLLGVFALAGCLASWRYVHWRWGSPSHQTPVIRFHHSRLRRLNPLFWLKDRQERKRLRKLFGEDKSDRDRWM